MLYHHNTLVKNHDMIANKIYDINQSTENPGMIISTIYITNNVIKKLTSPNDKKLIGRVIKRNSDPTVEFTTASSIQIITALINHSVPVHTVTHGKNRAVNATATHVSSVFTIKDMW